MTSQSNLHCYAIPATRALCEILHYQEELLIVLHSKVQAGKLQSLGLVH